MPETAEPKVLRDARGGFLSGTKPGPGRPKGSRAKLGEDFLGDLHKEWREHGAAAITAMREEKPGDFVKVVAGVIPQQLEIKSVEGEMSDEQLATALDAINALLAVTGSAVGTEPGPTRGSGEKAKGRGRKAQKA